MAEPKTSALDTEQITRLKYLTIKALERGTHPMIAIEAASSVALSHPEWDMDETRTYNEWKKGDHV